MKNFIVGTLFTIVLILVVCLAYIFSGSYNVSQLTPDGAVAKWIINKTKMNSIKKRSKKIEVPELSDSTKIAIGFSHYNEMCVLCHLAPGVKESEIARGLYPDPPKFTESKNIPDARSGFWIVKNGIKMTGMPAFSPTHKDDDIWAIIAFLTERMPGISESMYNYMKATYPKEHDE